MCFGPTSSTDHAERSPSTASHAHARGTASLLGQPPIPFILLWVLSGLLQPLTAFAVDPSGTRESEESASEITPPRLIKRAPLSYPESAIEHGLHGDVSVLTEVDASGRVTAAHVESGPEVFHQSALEAAFQLLFSPALQNETPVATTTRVFFHFAPPGNERADRAEEIVIHGENPDLESTKARTTLDEAALDQSTGDDLAETVSQVPGVRVASGTADASKPIIRGLRERRLLVLFDGVRHESQKWGANHATEIDPFAAGAISVVRGAAGARFGPDAIGGVILVAPPPLRSDPGVGGKAVLAYESNGRRPYGALRLDVAPESVPGLSFRMEGNGSAGANLRSPDYLLGNTASNNWNFGTSLGYSWNGGQIRASWSHYDFQGGVFYGVSNSTPAEFEAQLKADRPVTADLWSSTYAIDRAYQDVTHDTARLRTDLFGDWGALEVTYAFQLNHRMEFEQVREGVTGPQYDFTLRTHSIDALYRHNSHLTRLGEWTGGFGVQGSFQENVYRGYSLIPNHRSFSGGIFAFERLSLTRFDLEVGGRVDGMSRTAFLGEDDFNRHIRRGTLTEDSCVSSTFANRCPAAYETASITVGGITHVVPGLFDLKLDLSTASRFPNVDELYLIGTAPTFPVYALGYPDLGVETAWGGSLTAGLRHAYVEAEVSGYGQWIDDYIYFSPDLSDAGEPRFDVTIRGTWPRFTYQPIDAVLYGLDGSLVVAPEALVSIKVHGALVRAQDSKSGQQLIGTPPDHLHSAIVARPPSLGPFKDIELTVSGDLVARQSRVEASADFAPPPPGYALLGLAAETALGAKKSVRVGAEARNLLNTSYREYTSLLRYYADQPGRDIRIRITTIL